MAACCLAVCGRAEPWKFVFLSDCNALGGEGTFDTNTVSRIATAIAAERPAFVLFGGDQSRTGSVVMYSAWSNAMSPVYQAGIVIYPAVGNHDANDQAGFTNVYAPFLPLNGPANDLGRTYTVEHSNALVLVLNAFVPYHSYRFNQQWIDSVLATNTRPHVFAVGHVPAFKGVHPDCLDDFPDDRDRFWDSLGRAGGRIYFCGHDHFYDHTRIDDGDGNPDNDLHQMVVGTAGGPIYTDGTYDGNNSRFVPVRIDHDAAFGFVLVTVDGYNVTVARHFLTETNTFEISTNSFSYQVSDRPRLVPGWSDGRLVLSWWETATLQAAPGPEGTFTNVATADSSYIVTNRPGERMFYRLVRP